MQDTAMDRNENPPIPEERRFVWRNLDAFLTGDISPEDRARIEAFLCDCPYTREYVQTEQQFAQAVRRCVTEDAVKCPEGLRERVLTALARCEIDEEPPARERPAGRLLGFPWLGAVMMTAASIMLVVALVLVFGGGAEGDGMRLPDGLAPMVESVSMDVPQSEKCRYGDASAEYSRYFADGPELPHRIDGKMMRVSDFSCEEVNGSRVMRAVYDTSDGMRFGLIVFNCNCLDKRLWDDLQCAEVKVHDKIVLIWREGDYFRALVGPNSEVLLRHMQAFRKSY
jgi:hypothetical protein